MHEKNISSETETTPQRLLITIGRHGPTSLNERGEWQGGGIDASILRQETIASLQARGIEAMARPDIVVVSGLKRTRETWEIIREMRGWPELPIITHAGLNERGLGEFLEGKTRAQGRQAMVDGLIPVDLSQEEIEALSPGLDEILLAPDFIPPGGESINQVRERVEKALGEIFDTYPEQHAYVSSHFGVLYALGAETGKLNRMSVHRDEERKIITTLLTNGTYLNG